MDRVDLRNYRIFLPLPLESDDVGDEDHLQRGLDIGRQCPAGRRGQSITLCVLRPFGLDRNVLVAPGRDDAGKLAAFRCCAGPSPGPKPAIIRHPIDYRSGQFPPATAQTFVAFSFSVLHLSRLESGDVSQRPSAPASRLLRANALQDYRMQESVSQMARRTVKRGFKIRLPPSADESRVESVTRPIPGMSGPMRCFNPESQEPQTPIPPDIACHETTALPRHDFQRTCTPAAGGDGKIDPADPPAAS